MTIENIKKFASDACTVIDACQQMIADQEAEIAELRKKASEAPATKVEAPVVSAAPAMDSDKLMKAASAVYELYGSPSKVSAQAIADAWSEKPELMLNVIQKFASQLITSTNVSGAKLGEAIAKTASADKDTDADSQFWARYEN